MKIPSHGLLPGQHLRGTRGPRRIVRIIHTLYRHNVIEELHLKVEALTKDADGELRYTAWDSEATVSIL